MFLLKTENRMLCPAFRLSIYLKTGHNCVRFAKPDFRYSDIYCTSSDSSLHWKNLRTVFLARNYTKNCFETLFSISRILIVFLQFRQMLERRSRVSGDFRCLLGFLSLDWLSLPERTRGWVSAVAAVRKCPVETFRCAPRQVLILSSHLGPEVVLHRILCAG